MKRGIPAMKRKRPPVNKELVNNINQQLRRIQTYSSLVTRASLYSGFGSAYDGDRNLYTALGYKTDPGYSDYYQIYSREGVAKRVNDAECEAIWNYPPTVNDDKEVKDSEFEKVYNQIVKEQKLYNKLNRCDKLLGFGTYSLLLLGFNDVENEEGYKAPVQVGKNLKLVYTQCYSSEYATVKTIVQDVTDPRFGMPEIYTISISSTPTNDSAMATPPHTATAVGAKTTTANTVIEVHHSRVIHILQDNLQNEVYGEPRLKVGYNRLTDIQKVVGGGSEMFWRGGRPGFVANVDPEATWDEDDPSVTDMQDQLDEYEHNLRRVLYLQGVDLKSLDQQIADPMNQLDVNLQILSAGYKIPKRILTGSERGELASSQDRSNWFEHVISRRANFAEPIVLEPFINRLIEYKILPVPSGDEYYFEWENFYEMSDKEKAEVGRIRSESLAKYVSSTGSDQVLAPEMFIKLGMGLNDDQVKEVEEWVVKMEKENERLLREEEIAMREEEERLLREEEEDEEEMEVA